MTDRILVDRMFNSGTPTKPKWKRVRYFVSGENYPDRFPDKSAHEIAKERMGEMLKGKHETQNAN